MKLISLLASFGAFASTSALTDYAKQNLRKHLGENKFVTVPTQHLDVVRELLTEHPFDTAGIENGALHMKLSNTAVELLTEHGIKLEDITEMTLEKMERALQQDMFCTLSDEECAELPAEDFYATYQKLPALHSRLDTMAAATDLAEIESIGSSYEGRDLKAIHIGDQTKPLVFLTCNIHAREWIPPIFCTYLAETLIGDGTTGHPLLENFSFTILPSQNPDGYVYSYEVNPQWRKTRKPNPGSSCVGTDGNRNYDSFWGGDGASNDPCSDTYHGHNPFDNPETAFVRDFSNREDVKSRMISYHDVHSYGSYWLYPWSGIFELPPEEDLFKQDTCSQAAKDAIIATTGEVYTIGPSAATLYVAAGVADDYHYEKVGVVFSDTIEHRSGGATGFDGFYPPPENIMLANVEVVAGLEAHLACIFDFELSGNPPSPPCEDMDPNGIFFSDGTPAPCDEIGAYCSAYDFVAERCPATCGTCDAARVVSKENIKIQTIVPVAAAGNVGTIVAGVVGSAALIVVVAGVAYKIKRNEN